MEPLLIAETVAARDSDLRHEEKDNVERIFGGSAAEKSPVSDRGEHEGAGAFEGPGTFQGSQSTAVPLHSSTHVAETKENVGLRFQVFRQSPVVLGWSLK